ncbi:MAG: murein biosynthesis integral membrane protein MurJ [Alphaproteobacteria bacterium]|nr:murein biosynthesis integral membrane protein MurJ [Alphaproteobacteria bacterium]
MKLFKAMATVAVLTSVSRVAGFVRDLMTAAYIGAGPVSDAFFVALKLPNFFRRVTAEGAFSVSFVPLYSETLEKDGEKEAQEFASDAFMIMFWALSVFTVFALFAMPWIMYVIAPGFGIGEYRYTLAVELARITFPYLVLMSLSALLGGALNAVGRFAPFAIAPALFNVCLIVALLLRDFAQTPGHAMAWGIVISGVLQLAWLLVSAARSGIRIRFKRPALTPRIKKVFKLMGPGVVGAGVIQINLFADMVMGSFLAQGSISHLYYADRLNQLPLGMVGIAVGTALLPMLSRALVKEDISGARDLFNRSLELCLLLALPAAAALMVLPVSIITGLFERGEFTHADSIITGHVLAGYAFGLPSYIAIKVFSSAHWARQDTMTPVRISVAVTVTNIILSIILIQFIGVVGIAISMGVTGWMQFALHMRALENHPAVKFDERFIRVWPRIALSTALMAIVLLALEPFARDLIHSDSSGKKIVGLGMLVAPGGLVYAISIFATGVLKISEIKSYFKGKVK